MMNENMAPSPIHSHDSTDSLQHFLQSCFVKIYFKMKINRHIKKYIDHCGSVSTSTWEYL